MKGISLVYAYSQTWCSFLKNVKDLAYKTKEKQDFCFENSTSMSSTLYTNIYTLTVKVWTLAKHITT